MTCFILLTDIIVFLYIKLIQICFNNKISKGGSGIVQIIIERRIFVFIGISSIVPEHIYSSWLHVFGLTTAADYLMISKQVKNLSGMGGQFSEKK